MRNVVRGGCKGVARESEVVTAGSTTWSCRHKINKHACFPLVFLTISRHGRAGGEEHAGCIHTFVPFRIARMPQYESIFG